ncbi:MAG: hemolysin III family protein [Acholeplasma sp.]|nr:hemolysin III family protein [Acholeplasma sp.]
MQLKKTQTLGEEIANAISHGIGAGLGIIALVLMLFKANNGYEVFGSLVFGLSIIILYLMSTLYHAFKPNSKVKRVFKRFDHISIYVLIGGTFAPIFIMIVEKPLGWYYLIGQWTLIVLGIIFKAIKINKFKIPHLMLYLLLGWSGLTLFGPLYAYSSPAFYFILAGGIAYTVGVIFYVLSRVFKYSHFIWHIFVFLGTLLHFIAIYGYLM